MKNIIILFATILLFAVSAFSQIEGRVVDAKGNGVPKVTVTATGADGAVAATVTTDDEGKYVFEELQPGKYKIEVKGSAAFRPAVRENVNVTEDETTTLDITLTAVEAVQAPVPPPSNCVLVLSSASASLTAFGTTTNGLIPLTSQTFTVTPTVTPALARSHACDGVTWTATSSTAGSTLPWLTVTGGASGAGPGPGTVSSQAMSNPQTASRTATITVRMTSSGSSPVAVPSPLTFAVNEAGDTGEILLQRQVRAMYQAILGRDPDAGGFAFWTGLGSAGLGQMVDSLMTSPGAVGTDWATMLAYQAAVHSGPTFAQYSVAVVALRTGAQTPTGLLTSLNASLTTTAVYNNLLGRNPVGAEGSQTPAGAYVTIIASAEFKNTGAFKTATDHTNGLYIRLLYFLTLSRNPDQGGYNFWVANANALTSGLFYNGPPAARISILGNGQPNNGLVGSPEFQQRFQ